MGFKAQLIHLDGHLFSPPGIVLKWQESILKLRLILPN